MEIIVQRIYGHLDLALLKNMKIKVLFFTRTDKCIATVPYVSSMFV